MKQLDTNRLAMCKTLHQYLAEKDSVWNLNTPFSEGVLALGTAISDTDTAAQAAQSLKSTGVTAQRNALREIADRRVTLIAKSTRAYAIHIGDLKLIDDVRFTARIKLGGNAKQIRIMRSVLSAAAVYSEKLLEYGLDDKTFAKAGAAISAFEAAFTAPRAVITTRVAVTADVGRAIKRCAAAVRQLDLLVNVFGEEDSAFVTGYRAARVIAHYGEKHMSKEEEKK